MQARQRTAEASALAAKSYEITEADRVMAKLDAAKRARENLESSFEYRSMEAISTPEMLALRAATSPAFAGIPRDEMLAAAKRLSAGLRGRGYSRAEIAGLTSKQVRQLIERELKDGNK